MIRMLFLKEQPIRSQKYGWLFTVKIYVYNKTDMVNPPDYSFNKGGMINFTRYMATCFAKYNIRVNCVSPGGFYIQDKTIISVKSIA